MRHHKEEEEIIEPINNQNNGHCPPLTDKEAAQYLNLSVYYLRKLRWQGRLPGKINGPKYIKIGRTIRYLQGDLDAWLNNFRPQ